MRFRHPDGSLVHLAYCTNVHPAEDLDGVIAQLDGCSALVRKELDVTGARRRTLARAPPSPTGSRTPPIASSGCGVPSTATTSRS